MVYHEAKAASGTNIPPSLPEKTMLVLWAGDIASIAPKTTQVLFILAAQKPG